MTGQMVPDRPEIRLAIVGTRVLACPGDAVNVGRWITGTIAKLVPDVVISGGADGVDAIAALLAAAHGYTEAAGSLVVHRPQVQRFHGPGGYRERDALIAEDCTHLLRLSCRQATTYGSGWTADEAERLGRTVNREQVCDR